MKDISELRILDIAEKAKTSIGTVDRVIHNRPGVSEKTRQRVLEVLKEYNYRPNLIARKSVGTKKIKIAVLLPDSGTAFWRIHPEGINKASKELKLLGVEIDTFTFELNSKEEYSSHLETIKTKGYDALLAVPIFYEEIISFCKETKITVVFFDTTLGEEPGIDIRYIGENAYQTGMVGGKLLSSGIQSGDTLLIIGNKFSSDLRVIEREIGVKHFFASESSFYQVEQPRIIRLELLDLKAKSIEEKIETVFRENPSISRIFINSCRATSVCAPYLERKKQNRNDLKIVGYDLTDENIFYLKKGVIDFLINKHPREQCYQGIKMLYESLVLRIPIPEKTYMPIDIIIKENVDYYKMLQINK